MAQKDSFLFYRSYIEAVDKLPAERRYAYLRALAYYALDGTEPELEGAEELAFGLMKANIDSCNKRYATSVANGKKGGAPRGNQNAKREKQRLFSDEKSKNNLETSQGGAKPCAATTSAKKTTQEQPKNNPNVNDNDNDNLHCTSRGEGFRPPSPPNDGRGTENEPEQIEQNRTGWRPVVE